MRRLFKEATKIIEEDVRWLHDAAERFEEVAHLLPQSKRASWILLPICMTKEPIFTLASQRRRGGFQLHLRQLQLVSLSLCLID